MRSILSLLLVVVVAGAQEPIVKAQAAKETTVKAQVAKETTAKDERVQVLLKNGHSLIGIAKAGVRCERLVRGNFKPGTDTIDRAAGIRVWYYQDLDGYIFLEAKSLERVDVLGTLTSEESRALSDAVAAAHGTRMEAPASRPASPAKAGETADSRPAQESNGLTPAEKAVLEKFPPDKGWCPEKFGELQRKKIVLHVSPSDEEQAFIDDFPAFQGAWRKWLAAQPSKTDEVKSDEPAEPKRNSRK
jgi:hypothetical protein